MSQSTPRSTPQSTSQAPPLPDWLRAHGAPLFKAQIRSRPEDFQVTEDLGWEPSGDGEHDYLFIEKIGANTEWVAKQLAHYANVPDKDVGFSGLKDRHAITRQWFSVPRWHSPDWSQLAVEGVRVVNLKRHLRKLRRGAHRSNVFIIVLRYEDVIDADSVRPRVRQIAEGGVPNYFGEQRFGRNGGNLRLADSLADGKRLPRDKRSMAISTIRSYVFNSALSARVAQSTWNHLIPGDKANLEGSGSVFDIVELDAELRGRCETMDIHPAGVLVGAGSDCQPEHWQKALEKARVTEDNRSLRLKVYDLTFEIGDTEMMLSFSLGRGAYATSVLRELCHW